MLCIVQLAFFFLLYYYYYRTISFYVDFIYQFIFFIFNFLFLFFYFLFLLFFLDPGVRIDRSLVNMERESEGQKTNNSQNRYINCSIPKVILSISFSDKMNKPISNIENAKNRYNNYKNKEILKKYLTQGVPESITAMHNENDQQNRSNNDNHCDRVLKEVETEVERGCLYVSYTLTANNTKNNYENKNRNRVGTDEEEEEKENNNKIENQNDVEVGNRKDIIGDIVEWNEDDTLCLIAVPPPSYSSPSPSSSPSSSSSCHSSSSSSSRTLYTTQESPFELYEYTEQPRQLFIPPSSSSTSSIPSFTSSSVLSTADTTINPGTTSYTTSSKQLHGYTRLPLPKYSGWFVVSYVRTYIGGLSSNTSNESEVKEKSDYKGDKIFWENSVATNQNNENNVSNENQTQEIKEKRNESEYENQNQRRIKTVPAVIVRNRVEIGRSDAFSVSVPVQGVGEDILLGGGRGMRRRGAGQIWSKRDNYNNNHNDNYNNHNDNHHNNNNNNHNDNNDNNNHNNDNDNTTNDNNTKKNDNHIKNKDKNQLPIAVEDFHSP